jgi:predicted ATPase
LGRADEGLTALGTGLAGCDEIGFILLRPRLRTLFAEACRVAGQLPAALEHLTEAQRLTDETGERWTAAETLRLRGDVLLATGNPAGAEAGYREAIAIAQQQSAKLWELRAGMSLARLWRDQGKRTEARDRLAPVYGWFAEGFGTPLLQEAKALLAELA